MKKLEITFTGIACVLAVLWYLNPNGNYEPIIVFLALSSSLIAGFSHRAAKKKSTSTSNAKGIDKAREIPLPIHSSSNDMLVDAGDKVVIDVRSGVIESFENILFINGDRVLLEEIQSYEVKSIDEEIVYSNILLYLLYESSRAFERALEAKDLNLWHAVIAFFLPYPVIKIMEFKTGLVVVDFVIKGVALLFVAWVLLIILFVALATILHTVLSVVDRFNTKFYTIKFIEVICSNTKYRIWIPHKDAAKGKSSGVFRDDYRDFNNVYYSLKQAIFNTNSKKVIVNIYENGVYTDDGISWAVVRSE